MKSIEILKSFVPRSPNAYFIPDAFLCEYISKPTTKSCSDVFITIRDLMLAGF